MPQPRSTPPAPDTFAGRRAARLQHEQEHGIPTRRIFSLRAGENAQNTFTFVDDTDATPGRTA
ncbi:hypothetical protein SAMN05660199_03959 [Klenkia soli]|uniref:Uncharacterized protein n=1 Tax=Klenkia soli TaxID=1052260 RepID=A0A1H0SXD2_9ACTN|nr:hypothetical protein [Klenkia soli]SDP46467.1 hypothetical protein SAMN05660199_03959 [Klenkia soli]